MTNPDASARETLQSPRRIGIFGGSFDPPHLAHHALARVALEDLALNQLHIVPTGQAWHKRRALTAAAHRVAMVRLAFADLAQVCVDLCEVQRAGPSYTVDTLRELRAQWPLAQLFLVLGQDQAQALSAWHEWQAIVRLAMICVAKRTDEAKSQALNQHQFVPPKTWASRLKWLPMPAMPVSATRIRAAVSSKQSLAGMVAEPVARYIEHHHLYQTAVL